jgi:hypothetical protein
MTRFLLVLAVFLLVIWLLLGSHAHAQSAYKCPGFEPAAPVGCRGPPRCMCDEAGRCSWIFNCSDDQLNCDSTGRTRYD